MQPWNFKQHWLNLENRSSLGHILASLQSATMGHPASQWGSANPHQKTYTTNTDKPTYVIDKDVGYRDQNYVLRKTKH